MPSYLQKTSLNLNICFNCSIHQSFSNQAQTKYLNNCHVIIFYLCLFDASQLFISLVIPQTNNNYILFICCVTRSIESLICTYQWQSIVFIGAQHYQAHKKII